MSKVTLQGVLILIVSLFLPRLAMAGCQQECSAYTKVCNGYKQVCNGYTEVCTGYEDNGTCDSYTEECTGGYSQQCTGYTNECTSYTTVCTTPSCTLTASPADTAPGYSTTLTLTPSEPVTSSSLSGPSGNISFNGSTAVVSPSSTSTYTATVSNSGGTAQCSVTVSVFTPPNIAGNWTNTAGGQIAISQAGTSLTITYGATTASGLFLSNTDIQGGGALSGLTGLYNSPGQTPNTIDWINASTGNHVDTWSFVPNFTAPIIKGTWNAPGLTSAISISQSGDSLTFTWPGVTTNAVFISASEISFQTLIGHLNANDNTITWDNPNGTVNSTWTKAAQLNPPNIAGTWTAPGLASAITISESGNNLTFSWPGVTTGAVFITDSEISFQSFIGQLSANGNTITWDNPNGTVNSIWTNITNISPPNIAGTWTAPGLASAITISESGDNLTFSWPGVTTGAVFISDSEISFQSFTGQLSANGNTITWDAPNGTVNSTWTKATVTGLPNVAGNWKNSAGGAIAIQQSGSSLTFTYGATTASGVFENNTTIQGGGALGGLTGLINYPGETPNCIDWIVSSNGNHVDTWCKAQ